MKMPLQYLVRPLSDILCDSAQTNYVANTKRRQQAFSLGTAMSFQQITQRTVSEINKPPLFITWRISLISVHPPVLRHDEWIGHERIIGRGAKNTRTRNGKEPAKNMKPQPKPTAKPVPKPAPKKNGKNGAGQSGRPPSGGKCNKRTPSPTMNTCASGRNGNGSRSCKNRNEKTEPGLEGS